MRKTPNPMDKFANSTIANARNVTQMPRVPDYIRNFHSSPEWRKAWSDYEERLDGWRKNLAMSIGSPPATNGTTVATVETGVVVAAPPAQHDHPISEVTDLQDALDGKSDTGHTHAIDDVEGLQDALDSAGAAVSSRGFVLTSTVTVATETPTNFCPDYEVDVTAVGDVFRITAAGYMDVASGTLSVEFIFGSVMAPLTIQVNAAVGWWRLEATVTVRTIGASGTALVEAMLMNDVQYSLSGSEIVVDTTAEVPVELFGNVAGIEGDDFIDCRSLIIEKM